MRPDFNGDIAVAYQVQVGMMAFFLGKLADTPEKVESGKKVLNNPFAPDTLAVGCQFPVRHLRKIALHLLGRYSRYTPFTRHTMLTGQLAYSRSSHTKLLLHAEIPGSSHATKAGASADHFIEHGVRGRADS